MQLCEPVDELTEQTRTDQLTPEQSRDVNRRYERFTWRKIGDLFIGQLGIETSQLTKPT